MDRRVISSGLPEPLPWQKPALEKLRGLLFPEWKDGAWQPPPGEPNQELIAKFESLEEAFTVIKATINDIEGAKTGIVLPEKEDGTHPIGQMYPSGHDNLRHSFYMLHDAVLGVLAGPGRYRRRRDEP